MKPTSALWYGVSVPSNEGPFAARVREVLDRACGEDEAEAPQESAYVQWWRRRNALQKLARLRNVAFVDLGEHHASFGLAISDGHVYRATGDEVSWVNEGANGVTVHLKRLSDCLNHLLVALGPALDPKELKRGIAWRMAAFRMREDRGAIYTVELKDRDKADRWVQAQDAARFFGQSLAESGRYVFAAYEHLPEGPAFVLRPALTEEELAKLNEQNSHLAIEERRK